MVFSLNIFKLHRRNNKSVHAVEVVPENAQSEDTCRSCCSSDKETCQDSCSQYRPQQLKGPQCPLCPNHINIPNCISNHPAKHHDHAKPHEGTLGVIRLDYDYPAQVGDIDHPDSFPYEVIYEIVPGLTFQMAQSGEMTPEVESNFKGAIEALMSQGVDGITGDCGFMMYFQGLAREFIAEAYATCPKCKHTPVYMSALTQLPIITCSFSPNEKIAIMTANGKTLMPILKLLQDECGVHVNPDRFVIVGCENVPGFDAVEKGEKVDKKRVAPGIVAKAEETLRLHPEVKCFLLECTELPPYRDSVYIKTGRPVFDALTVCHFFMSHHVFGAHVSRNEMLKV